MSDPNNSNASYAQKTLTGALYMTTMRWVIRLIGLISISITARVLTPEDFGIHSSAAIVLGFLLVFRHVGVGQFLIKEKTLTPELVNTAWSIGVISSAIASVALLILAPFASILMKDDRVTLPLYIMAFIPFIDALNSPQTMLLMREFRFKAMFRFRVVEKAISFACSVGLVVYFQTFWAIAAANLLSSVLVTAYTYKAFPYQLRVTLREFKAVGSFAGLALGRSISQFVASLSDSVAARQLADSSLFGGYHNTKRLSQTLVGEAATPIANTMFPALSRMAEEPHRLFQSIRNGYGVLLYWALFCALGVHLLADPIVRLLLGDQWLFAIPFLAIAAFISVFITLEGYLGQILIVIKEDYTWTKFLVLKALACALIFFFLSKQESLILILYSLLILLILFNLCVTFFIGKKFNKILQIISVYIRPLLCSAITYCICNEFYSFMIKFDFHFIFNSVLTGVLICVVFPICAALLWLVSGRKKGPEVAFWNLIMDRISILR